MNIFKIFTIFKGRSVGVNVAPTRESAERIVRDSKTKTGREYSIKQKQAGNTR